MMKFRTVGKTGIQVSSLCFGTMSFGGYADEDSSKAMFESQQSSCGQSQQQQSDYLLQFIQTVSIHYIRTAYVWYFRATELAPYYHDEQTLMYAYRMLIMIKVVKFPIRIKST